LVTADTLNDPVIPFFEEHDLRLLKVLTDKGTEYCVVREQHEYQFNLSIEDIGPYKSQEFSNPWYL